MARLPRSALVPLAERRTAIRELVECRTWGISWRSTAIRLHGARGAHRQDKRNIRWARRPWSRPCAQVLHLRLDLHLHLDLFPRCYLLMSLFQKAVDCVGARLSKMSPQTAHLGTQVTLAKQGWPYSLLDEG